LVASLGVATVSFMGLQTGCEDGDGHMTFTANLLAIPLDGSIDFSTVPPIPDAGGHASYDAAVIPVSGNLIAPIQDSGPKDAAVADALITSGNLLPPPPPDAAVDAASDAAAKDGSAPKDARVDTGIPSSGNLLPPIGPR
jgi:hypothetical protein